MLEKLFTNAGEKIKNYAKTLFVIESIAAIMAGIAVIAEDEDMFLMGILVAAAAIAFAYISSLFLAAFGELVESSSQNKNINEQFLQKLSENAEK